jgi:gamma-glutamylcysteine synthetase
MISLVRGKTDLANKMLLFSYEVFTWLCVYLMTTAPPIKQNNIQGHSAKETDGVGFI